MEKEQFRTEIRLETEFMIKSLMREMKEEILADVRQEIDVQVNLLMNGKKIDNVNIGEIVADEVLRQLKSSI